MTTLFDLILEHGDVIDGTNRPRCRADVGIQGDRIVAIGDLGSAESRLSIDASGQVVAPGFIDVHNHSDGWLLKMRHFAAKTLQGFTTEILMADGISYAPVNQFTKPQWLYYLRSLDGLTMQDDRGWQSLGDYMQQLDATTAQNSATHIPYANVRSMVSGFGRRRLDDFQIRQVQYEIRKGMDEGAVGLSTGLDYIVECFSTTDELVAACQAMSDRRGVYVSHVRYKKGLIPALTEAVEIGRRADVPVHISHLKSQPDCDCDEIFAFLDRARQDVELSYDVYPYQPGSTMLNYLLPNEVWEEGPLAAIAILNQSEMRERFRQGIAAYKLDLDHIRLAWVQGKANAPHIGKTLAQFVEESGQSKADALLNLLIEESLAVLCVMDEGDDRLVHPMLNHDLAMIGTDGIYYPDSVVHPRVFGSVGRILGPFVRDLKLFSLETAVHKLSGFAAERFQLRDRGVLAKGAFADAVVFDPAQMQDRSTFADPHQTTVGINHVVVNGVPIVRDGTPIDDFETEPPGRFVRAG
ncbi:MAG TPA: D-aminoacylase [Pirellulaceae bacterium]|nr:D-aminoacylase [Pirellulaceae bacterium]